MADTHPIGQANLGFRSTALPGVVEVSPCNTRDAPGTAIGWSRDVNRDAIKRAPMSRITFDPAQCGGRPCIRVKDVLELLAAGVAEAEILTDYPFLEQEDIRACLAFPAAEMDHPVLVTAAP
jgi:uncharacterized protein (DUF433 family)